MSVHFILHYLYASTAYWLPRSVCIINGKSVLRIALAFSIVFITVETSIVSARVHAIIFLANRSITQLRYTKPSLVHTYVMSVHQTAFGRSELNCSLSMLWSSLLKSESFVVAIHGFDHLALMPISRMYLPTVRCDMVSQDFCKSLVIFGAP